MKRFFGIIITVLAVYSSAFTATADISIRFFDKTIYYPGLAGDNPILVRLTIANTGSETLRFKLAEDRVFSIDFAAYTVKNLQLPHTDGFIRKRSSNQSVFFREVTLEPGEEYSFIENIKDYISIKEPGIYYLEAWFYPELNRLEQPSGLLSAVNVSDKTELSTSGTNISANPLISNRLNMEIRPAPLAAAATVLPVSSETQQILHPEQIPPDQVVRQTIIARQKELWEQYFLYMDLEEMLMRDPSRSRKYRAESAGGRRKMLENYKNDLRQERIDKDIVAIPESFQIEKTMYTTDEGTVTVIEWFKYDTYREKKRYTYYLKRRDGIWRIYDYTVDNLGTE